MASAGMNELHHSIGALRHHIVALKLSESNLRRTHAAQPREHTSPRSSRPFLLSSALMWWCRLQDSNL